MFCTTFLRNNTCPNCHFELRAVRKLFTFTWSLWTSTLPSALEVLTERRNKNQKQHSEKGHSFFLNSDYTKVKKKFLHIHHNTSFANLSSSSLADQRLSMWFLPVVMQYFIGHEIVLTIKTKLNSRLLYAGFLCILKLSV